MSAKSVPMKMQGETNNVIAFPQARRMRGAVGCEDTSRAAVCAHCGGLLAKGESEDDCSGARVFRTS